MLLSFREKGKNPSHTLRARISEDLETALLKKKPRAKIRTGKEQHQHRTRGLLLEARGKHIASRDKSSHEKVRITSHA